MLSHDWAELDRAEPRRWTVAAIRRRLAQTADPWRDLDRDRGSASAALDRLG